MNDEYRDLSNSDLLGVVYTGRSTITVDAFGKRRPVSQLNRWEWLFLVVSIINIVMSVGLSSYRLIFVILYEPDKPDFVFCILLIANSVFCLVYIFNGLLKELEYEIYMFICAVIFLIIYCVVEYVSNLDKQNSVKLIRLIVCCALGPLNIALAVYVARRFGWLEFRIIGASQRMQHMYQQAALFVSLLKFDLQASVSFVILILQHGMSINTEYIIVLSCGIPFCILLALLGRSAMIQEWKWMAILYALLGLVSPGYVIYSVVTTYQNLQTAWLLKNKSIVYSQFIVGFLALVVRSALLYEFFFVFKNFGKGLRQRAFDDVANERTGLLARGT